MRTCPHCNISVGGSSEYCPLCQNALIGEASEDIWPAQEVIKGQSLLFSIQLFIVLSAAAISLCVDFLLEKHGAVHWSLLVLVWTLVGEWLIKNFSHKYHNKSGILTLSLIILSILLMITGHFTGSWKPIIRLVVPIIYIITLVVNFIMSMMEKKSNALAYLLATVVISAGPYALFFMLDKNISTAWTICLMVSLVTFIGVCVFKGRIVIMEIQKRTSL